MSESPEKPLSVLAYCREYLRVSTAMGIFSFLLALPAFLFLVTLSPNWAGYGVLSLSVLVLISAGEHLLPDTNEEEQLKDRLDQVAEQATQSEAILFIVGSYAILAGGVTMVLLTSASIAGTLGYAGYPLVAMAIALFVPYIDYLMSDKTGNSITNFGMHIAYYGIVVVGAISGLSTEPFRQTAKNGRIVY